MGAWALGHALGAIEETPEFPLRRADARHLPPEGGGIREPLLACGGAPREAG